MREEIERTCPCEYAGQARKGTPFVQATYRDYERFSNEAVDIQKRCEKIISFLEVSIMLQIKQLESLAEFISTAKEA